MNIPSADIDFYADSVILDPYPVYETLRELGPVVYLPRNDLYALARYDEVSEVLRQPLRFISSRGISPLQKVNDILVGSTLNSDPPQHDRTRAVTSEPLLPGALRDIEPRIRDAADGLIDTLCQRGEFDAIADFAQYLPVTIVAELVGLPDVAGVDNMLKWASATFNLFSTENARTVQAFEDLKDLRDFLKEYGRPEKLKPGGWARRIFEVGPERGLSPETCAQLMRDYINPSLDTTISTTGQIIKFLADAPDQWDLLRDRPDLIPNAVEEAVRMATPIRAFTRYVAKDSEIAGHPIPAGKRVLVIYASANRDPRKYADPDRFDVTRDVHNHVGFGQGVHMCMGMHLARLEITLLLQALRRRVQRFHLIGVPEVAMNNSIRAYARMPVRVDLLETPLTEALAAPKAETGWIDALVTSRADVATDIVAIEIQAADGTPLPAFAPGDHVDVQIRSGLVRQYSLAGDPAKPGTYRLGILRDPASRGGSAAVHAEFTIGKPIRVGRPRSNFPLDMAASRSILFAGGIGITPILSMACALHRAGRDFTLHYCGRSADRLAFVDELGRFGEHVMIHLDDGPAAQRLDLSAALGTPVAGTHVYCCGPTGFMDYVIAGAARAGWPAGQVHLERFGAEVNTDGAPFTVVAARAGLTVEVAPGVTIAQALTEAGLSVPMSCQSGVCGTCITRVLEGTPDHRDLVLTDHEKAARDRIALCCSRSQTRTLVLDL
ncbi:MAG: cytochrome P450/oxidoreductase [Paracoccaceae bacterium]